MCTRHYRVNHTILHSPAGMVIARDGIGAICRIVVRVINLYGVPCGYRAETDTAAIRGICRIDQQKRFCGLALFVEGDKLAVRLRFRCHAVQVTEDCRYLVECLRFEDAVKGIRLRRIGTRRNDQDAVHAILRQGSVFQHSVTDEMEVDAGAAQDLGAVGHEIIDTAQSIGERLFL